MLGKATFQPKGNGCTMTMLTASLFASRQPHTIGIGFHNIGSGCFAASHPELVQRIEDHYGQRCGHLPLEAEQVYVMVATPTDEIREQWAYLSQLMGKTITVSTPRDIAIALHTIDPSDALVVPYINTPQTEHWLEEKLGIASWGLPGKMVQLLKNKADFHQLVEDLHLEGMTVPEYKIVPVSAVPLAALGFLDRIEKIISEAGMSGYPLGIMLRAAESDGHYGSCLVYKQQRRILIIPDGDRRRVQYSSIWQDAFLVAQQHLMSCMDQRKEPRVVMSRFVDVVDSPGLSVVLLDGQIASLGWNSQLQARGSTACVGTGSYQPKNALLTRLQQTTEAHTVAGFESLLRQVALKCGLDFSSLRGVANLDLMLPGPQERLFRKRRGLVPTVYLAECNPRWTNYTDALLTVVAIKRQIPTVNALRGTIQEGLSTVDHYHLPPGVEPQQVRDELLRRDAALRQAETYIVCRMAHNPMGFIFAGNVQRAQQEIASLLRQLENNHTLENVTV